MGSGVFAGGSEFADFAAEVVGASGVGLGWGEDSYSRRRHDALGCAGVNKSAAEGKKSGAVGVVDAEV